MARGRQVTIQFIGDARSLISATTASGKATSTLGSRFKQLGKTAAIGAGLATVALAKGLWDVTEAAVADEAAAKSLALQLKNTTGATDAQVAAVESWITAQGKALGVTDDELRPALSKLATATGDVTRAQELLSVAMDVSAGTGKSLDAVTSALQKGVNGSVGGLARLGVKTKDAAGETKSFDAILGDLSKNFQGQAAKAADTTAGKFQRLKVNMSELGEEIGYKVLPYATEFGEWMLDEGIPAAEDLAHWVGDNLGPVLDDLAETIRDNSDEIRDFADGAGKQLVDALETTVRVGGQVVGVLDDLPGPVKELGIQAAIASRVMPGFTTGLIGARDSAGGFVTNVKDAEKRTAALGKAAKTAGGIGGMLLLADSTQRSSEALGILEGAAGGALMGSAAGPWGALIGGGIGAAMGILSHKTDDVAESMTEAKPAAMDYSDALDRITGAAKGSTRELIRLDLQQQGAFSSAKTLGISARDLVNYMMGQEGAVKRVNKAMRQATVETEGYVDMNGHYVTLVKGNKGAADALAYSLGIVTNNMKKSSAETLFNSLTAKNMTKVQNQLAKEYDATPREVRTAIKQVGAITSIEDTQRLIDKLEYLRKHPRVDTYITTHINQVKGHDINSGGPRIGAGFGADAGSRADFAASFGDMQSSIFGTQSDEPLTLQSLMAASAAEQAKAQKALADMAKLLSMGLSPALIKQFQSQGSAGLEALGVLATGTQEQIMQFNAQNAAAAAAYGGVGGLAATGVYGAEYDPATQFQTAFGGHGGKGGKGKDRPGEHDRALLDVLGKINEKLEGDTGKTVLRGTDLLIMFRRLERQLGRPLLASP